MPKEQLEIYENISNINVENITDDIYHFLMLDWKSTSLVSYKKTGENKKLKSCIHDIVNLSYQKSHFWYSRLVPELCEQISEEKVKDICSLGNTDTPKVKDLLSMKDIFLSIYEQEAKNKKTNGIHFSQLILNQVNKKYQNIDQLRPNYWEQFVKDYFNGKGLEQYYNLYQEKRKEAFNGLCFEKIDSTQFYNNVALPFVAQKSQFEPRIKILTDQIIDYTTTLHEIKNTHEITQKLLNLRSTPCEDITLEQFKDFFKYSPTTLDIEKKHKDDFEKSQLNGVLNKIKNKS